MGWTIKIGHPTLVQDEDDPPYVAVQTVELPTAPAYPGDLAGRTNDRAPSYTAWAGFVREVGLTELMADLMPAQADCGAVPLTLRHLAAVQAAQARYAARWPDVAPGWWDDDRPEAEQIAATCLARLGWLAWWMAWALRTDEGAAFYFA